MNCFVANKLALPSPIASISWSKFYNSLAVGSYDGLLKVVQLDRSRSGSKDSLYSSFTLELRGHDRAVVSPIVWDRHGLKLVSADSNGRVFVWKYSQVEKGWARVVEKSRQSAVFGVGWSFDNKSVAVAYADHQLFVLRLEAETWNRYDLAGFGPMKVCWLSNDAVLAGNAKGECRVLDLSSKKFVGEPLVAAFNSLSNDTMLQHSSGQEVVAIFNIDRDKRFAVVFRCGRVQVFASVEDQEPTVFDTKLSVSTADWSSRLQCLALGGSLPSKNFAILLVSLRGERLTTFRSVNNSLISDCCFDSTGKRLAISSDTVCNVLSIRKSFKYAFCGGIVVIYERRDGVVVQGEKEMELKRWNSRPISVAGFGSSLAVGYSTSDSTFISIYDAAGAQTDEFTTPINPEWIILRRGYLIHGNRDAFIRQSLQKTSTPDYHHIGSTQPLDKSAEKSKIYQQLLTASRDPIVCARERDSCLFLARSSGDISCFYFTEDRWETKSSGLKVVKAISVNCVGDKIAIVGAKGVDSGGEVIYVTIKPIYCLFPQQPISSR